MKGTKLAGLALLAVLASLAAIPASAAWAGKALVLSSEGTQVVNGSAGDVGIASLDECSLFATGTVAGNGTGAVTMTETETSEYECTRHSESTISGTVSSLSLKVGKATLVASITVTKPGPCIYNYTKFKGKFAVPGDLWIEGTTKGKLNKGLSSSSCAKTAGGTFLADGAPEVFGEPFETAL